MAIYTGVIEQNEIAEFEVNILVGSQFVELPGLQKANKANSNNTILHKVIFICEKSFF